MVTADNSIQVYTKLQKGAVLAFIVLLGGGASMVLISTITHDIIMWAMGVPIAGMSGIFVTLGLIAKSKLKQLKQ